MCNYDHMSWLHRIGGKPFPAPSGVKLPTEYPPGGWSVFDQMSPETAERETEWAKQQGGEMSYLDAGEYSPVVNLPNGNVGKYTKSPDEVARAEQMAKLQQAGQLTKVVPILRVRQVDEQNWMIEMERVQPLEPDEQKMIDRMMEDLPTFTRIRGQQPYGFEHISPIISRLPQYRDLLVKFWQLCNWCHINLPNTDMHSRNIGWHKGELVLLDLGRPKDRWLDNLTGL
jgi:hypothetical protein